MTASRSPSFVAVLRLWVIVVSLPLCCLVAQPTAAQLVQRSVAFEGARILTMDGSEFEEGTLIVSGTKIRAVGAEVKPSLFAKKIDAHGTTITPGLIDVASLLGSAGQRATSGASATRRAEDAFDHFDTVNIEEALRQGVTAVFLSPEGPAGICGTGAVIRLTRQSGVDGAIGTVLQSEAALCIDLSSASKPVARLKTLQGVEKALQAAQQYRLSLETYAEELAEYTKQLEEQAKKQAADKKEGDKKKQKPNPSAGPGDEPEKKPEQKPEKAGEVKGSEKPDQAAKPKKPRRPTRSLSNELLLRALDREIPVRVIAHRSNDILNAIALAETFTLDLILEGATEAHLVVDQIAKSKATVVLGRMDLPTMRRDDPTRRGIEWPGSVLDKSEVPWVVGSGASSSGQSRFIGLNAQMAAAYSQQHAPLSLITAEAADVLRTAQIGRLRPGALADFVLWSGDPLDPATKALRVFVGGQEVYSSGE